jgi:hypothetical protein
MAETYDWHGFYRALCEHGPQLLLGIDGDDGAREVIELLAADTDDFWSDGLVDLLAEGATAGDLRTGVLAALKLWRENVLMALSDDFGIELDWDAVTIDAGSQLIDHLVEAAAPDHP